MIDVAWAQGAAGGGGPPIWIQLLPFAGLFAVFYFLIIRPQQQKQNEHKAMLANLKKNDEVITSGGLYGRVIQLSDDVVTLEIAPNVRVRVSRPQIASAVTIAKVSGAQATNDKEKDKAK
ncbi:MAG TPA: preprotein translocase subunit YajC [Candidatus Dormibacteraeota bacterium]|nr:preprotein translocase subunit YajC [Candidatus Dormibacteraeota bacterium]